ncbi:MAG TPA: GrpB family protein [Pelotomaculum sp.]|nr:GrpB family protein [Pelotomaculum sp.]
MKIEIVEYNPDWIKAFDEEKRNVLALLGSHTVAIEHVGSTAISNQKAKPIIDIFIGVLPFMKLSFYETIFSSKDYRYISTDMTGRYLFAKYTNGVWTHNLHILPYNGEFYMRNEFLLRDYLREHPELVAEYGGVKKRAAIKSGNTMKEYTRSKTEFIC